VLEVRETRVHRRRVDDNRRWRLEVANKRFATDNIKIMAQMRAWPAVLSTYS